MRTIFNNSIQKETKQSEKNQISTDNHSLSSLVDEAFSVQTQINNLTEHLTNLKEKLKFTMKKEGLSKLSGKTGNVTLSTRVTTKWDEEGLLSYLKKNNLGCTKQITVIDEDQLETKIYNNEIVPNNIKPYQLTKSTDYLTIKENK